MLEGWARFHLYGFGRWKCAPLELPIMVGWGRGIAPTGSIVPVVARPAAPVHEKLLSLFGKAGYEVVYPEGLESRWAGSYQRCLLLSRLCSACSAVSLACSSGPACLAGTGPTCD
jgi:hypothetical protein